MRSRISFSGTGAKNTAKTQSLSPFRDRKRRKKFLDLTKRGKSNDIAHGSIIQRFYGSIIPAPHRNTINILQLNSKPLAATAPTESMTGWQSTTEFFPANK